MGTSLHADCVWNTTPIRDWRVATAHWLLCILESLVRLLLLNDRALPAQQYDGTRTKFVNLPGGATGVWSVGQLTVVDIYFSFLRQVQSFLLSPSAQHTASFLGGD